MSNLIALKDANNDIGLGTSYIGLGTNSGTSILPFKKNDGTILMNFNATNNSIHLGTIKLGTWRGNAIGTSYGGTGLTTMGSAGQVLSVKSNPNEGLEWTTISSSGGNAESVTSIATSASSAIGIGSRNQNVTINTSLLNINIGNTTPSNGQILKYNGSSLQWQTNSNPSLNNLFNVINTFHPGYILLLESLDVKINSVSQTLVPSFDVNTSNYNVGIGSNYTVSILPTLFSSTPVTKINSSTINIPNTSTYNIVDYASPNTFSITNSHNTSSRTYTLNITRTILHDADLKAITISTNPTITFNSFSSSTTTYNIDVLSSLTSLIMTAQVHNTSSYIFISTTQNNHNQTSLNINSTTGNVDATSNLENSITNKTITPIYVFIKAENTNITKEYTFNISRPPRSTVDITSIEILNSSSSLIGSTITSFTSTSTITTTNTDDYIKFRITKNHTHQTVNIKLGSNLLETLSATNEIVTSGNIANISQSDVTSGGSNGASQTYSLVITGADTTSTNTIDVIIKRPSSDDASLSFIGVDSSTTNRISAFSGSNNSFTNSTTINSSDTSVVIHFTAASNVHGQSVKVGLGNNYTSATAIVLNNNSSNVTVTGLSLGDNTINIQVTSQDTNVVRLYTFTKIYVLQSGNLLDLIQTRQGSTGTLQTVNSFSSSGSSFTLAHGSINDTLDIYCTRQTNVSDQATVSFSINNPSSLSPAPTSSVISTNIHHRFSGLSGSTKLIGQTTYTVTITVTSETGVDKIYSLTVVQKNTISTLSALTITDNSSITSTNNTSASLSLGTTTQSNLYITPNSSSIPVTIKFSTDSSYGSDTTMTNGNQSTLSLNTGSNNIYIYVVPEAGTVPTSGTIPNGDIDTGGQNISYRSIYYRTITMNPPFIDTNGTNINNTTSYIIENDAWKNANGATRSYLSSDGGTTTGVWCVALISANFGGLDFNTNPNKHKFYIEGDATNGYTIKCHYGYSGDGRYLIYNVFAYIEWFNNEAGYGGTSVNSNAMYPQNYSGSYTNSAIYTHSISQNTKWYFSSTLPNGNSHSEISQGKYFIYIIIGSDKYYLARNHFAPGTYWGTSPSFANPLFFVHEYRLQNPTTISGSPSFNQNQCIFSLRIS